MSSKILLEQVRDLLASGALRPKDITEAVAKNKKEKAAIEGVPERSIKNVENFAHHEATTMGIGEISAHNRVWPRVFRFKLFSVQEQLVNVFVQTVEFSLKSKTMEVHVLEGDHKIYDWVKYMVSDNAEDELALTTYDGCGQPLYSIRFKGVAATDHKFGFNYAESDVTTHELKLSFESFKRTNLVENYKVPFAKTMAKAEAKKADISATIPGMAQALKK